MRHGQKGQWNQGWAVEGLHYMAGHELPGGRNWSGNSRRGLGRQGEAEAPEKEFLVGVWLGVWAQDQGSAVGGWEVDVEHLDCG